MQRELTCQEVVSVITEYFAGDSQDTLANRYGIDKKAVYNLLYLITYANCSAQCIRERFSGQTNYFIELASRKTRGLGRKK